jgi:hypothetical protein
VSTRSSNFPPGIDQRLGGPSRGSAEVQEKIQAGNATYWGGRSGTGFGLGTVGAEESSGPNFAPNGRSKRWKLQQGDLTDAYRCHLGEPSRYEIHVPRRKSGEAIAA